MLVTENLSMEFKNTLGPEGYIPIMKAFDNVSNMFEEQKNSINVIKNDFTEYNKKIGFLKISV